MGILITGAQMGNKGAQSMLFVTVSELSARFPGQRLYFATGEEYDEQAYTFRKVACSSMSRHISALQGCRRAGYTAYALARDGAAYLLGKKRAVGHYGDLLRLAPRLDAIVDISGFALGDKWSRWSHVSYLDNIAFARNNAIPFYILPQSFGPFDYGRGFDGLKARMRSLLRYPRLIFSREDSGAEALRSLGVTDNVVRSSDLVLQNRAVDYDAIYTRRPAISLPALEGGKRAALIPNRQCFAFGNKALLMKAYLSAAETLDRLGYRTVILRHSSDDAGVCREIHSAIGHIGGVSLLDRDFSCVEFDGLIRMFDFALCSRFHGIVHSCKQNTPCVILGWADKYRALAGSLGQSEFNFDILSASFGAEAVARAIERMCEALPEQKERVARRLQDIQANNCFDAVEADMRETGVR